MIEVDFVFLSAMNEVLEITAEFVEQARNARDDVVLEAYLKMASRAMRCALKIYEDHLVENLTKMKQGEQ